jgi:hypothetical protein
MPTSTGSPAAATCGCDHAEFSGLLVIFFPRTTELMGVGVDKAEGLKK